MSDQTRGWAEDYGIRFVEVGAGVDVSDDEGTYTRWFDALDADALIVRPDFYVYDAVPASGRDEALLGLRSSLTNGLAVS